MNPLDLIIILVLLLNMVTGWRKGLLSILGEMGGLALGLWLGAHYTEHVAGFVSSYLVGPAWLLFVLSFLGLFIAGRLTAKVMAIFLKQVVAMPGLSSIDRLVGAAMGLGVGTIVVTFLVSLLAYLPWPYFVELIQSSEIGQYFWSAAPVFNHFLWQELRPLLPLPMAGPKTGI